MTFRDWPGRRLAVLWLLVATFYAGLALLGYFHRRNVEASVRWQYGMPIGEGADTSSSASRDSLLALMFAFLRETNRAPASQRDSVLDQLLVAVSDTPLSAATRDSIYRALNVPAVLSPAQRDSLRVVGESVVAPIVEPLAGAVGTALTEMGREMTPWVYLTYGLCLAPGVALVVATATWIVASRRRPRGSPGPAA